MKTFIFRSLIFISLWVASAAWVFEQSQKTFETQRFEFLILSNGRVSSVQRESLFREPRSIQAGDRILKLGDQDFSDAAARELLSATEQREIPVLIQRRGETLEGELRVRSYSKRDILVLFLLPSLISLIFLVFAVATPFQKFNIRKTQEAVEVFSLLCFSLSLFFLYFLPSVSFVLPIPVSLGLPVLGALFLHLFLVYPKKKAARRLRWAILTGVYFSSLALVLTRINVWERESWWFPVLEYSFLGAIVICALGSLGNTLFTSRDFWTRRRARLLSLAFFISFVGLISVYISFLWHGPRISLERILAVSLLFPAGFAFIFSKENVFDLERIFRRGLHQILFTGIAVTLAVLVGLSWTQWAEQDSRDWLLWAAIAMVVSFFVRPVGLRFESFLHRLVQTRVKYPKVDEIFATSRSVEDFLSRLSRELEKNLYLREIGYRFLKDPSAPWGDENEQFWQWEGDQLVHRNYIVSGGQYLSFLRSNEFLLGEIRFSGGDTIAFDPSNSRDWQRICQAVARCLELLILREYLVTQQSLLAVGRMQALIAHEMKNPLAVIKVCAGLLKDHIGKENEADELIRTIDSEVTRVTHAVQKVFDHPARNEKRVRLEIIGLIDQVRQSVVARFSQAQFRIHLHIDGLQADPLSSKVWVWMEQEACFQALTNLCVNAFEAGSPSLDVYLEVDKLKRLRIIFIDRGCGLSRDVELFKPFVSTKPFGTGLGLSQVKAFVDRHYGKISAKSRLKEGTSFYLDFPGSIFVKEEEWKQAEVS